MAERERVPPRPADEARFVGSWGLLLEAGLEEPRLLDHLAEHAGGESLQALAGACAAALRRGEALGPVLDEQGAELTSWVRVLLAVHPRRGEHLRAAAEQVLSEHEHGRRREQLWERLALLLRAGASPGEALGAIARAARERDDRPLAEALGAAARAARQGASWPEALATAGGLAPTEQLLLGQIAAAPIPTLERLAALDALQRRAALTTPAEALQRIAEAAQAGAAPLRRGLGRVLSGLEDALGRGARPEEGRDLAKRTVASRGERGEAPAEEAPPAAPEAPPE